MISMRMMITTSASQRDAGMRSRRLQICSGSLSSHLVLIAVMVLYACNNDYMGVVVRASDPDPLQDYCVADLSQTLSVNGYPCKEAEKVTEEDFVFHGIAQAAANVSESPVLAVPTFGLVEQFPGLNTLGLSVARLDFEPTGVIVPHTHPRASEIIFVLSGNLYCAFVDTSNKLFAKVLGPGDVMIFPRGLLHFQLNVGSGPAHAIVALNSQQPGFQRVANSLFTPNIPNAVLRKTFFLDDATLDSIKATFQSMQTAPSPIYWSNILGLAARSPILHTEL